MHLADVAQTVVASHCCVQYPPAQAVPLVVLCSVVQMPELQSVLATQGFPIGSIFPTQLPVFASQLRLVPQLQPWRQSGRHTFALVEPMDPVRQAGYGTQDAAE